MYTTDASSWENAPCFEAGPKVSVIDGHSLPLSRLTLKRTAALYGAEMRIFDFRERKKKGLDIFAKNGQHMPINLFLSQM
jgi:hypothetical protein